MQLSYHAYYFADTVTGECYRADIRPFISGFAQWRNCDFKNGFSHGGESVFLLPDAGSVYLFVQAKDTDIIKRIERSTISVSEIRDQLGDDESIGFASFIYLQEDYLAIGSTVLAPRLSAFSTYITTLLQKLDIGLKFVTKAMTHTLPTSDVQRLNHVGKFTMTVGAGNRLRDSFLASLGGGEREDFNIGSIEITVRPMKRRGDNSRALKAVIEQVGDEGLEALDARAKIDAADKMADFFIVGAGGIRDPIDTSQEARIVEQIIAATHANPVLEARLHEFRQDPDLASIDNATDLDLSWPPPRAVNLGSDPVDA